MKTTVVDELSFFVGVANLMFSTWLISSYPFNYWIWHCIKNCFLLVFRYHKFRQIHWHYYLLDFCYTVNYWTLLYFALCLLQNQLHSSVKQFLDTYGYYIFRVAFTWSMCPLALSVAAFRNSMVFHSIDHMTILAVHVGPPLAVYGMRWFSEELDTWWPNTFHIEVSRSVASNDSVSTLIYLPLLHYFCLWTLPYFAVIFILCAESNKKRGNATMYTFYEKTLLKYASKIGGEKYLPILYMALHGAAVSLSFVLSPLLWNSYLLNTGYLLGLVMVSVWNGSRYYFEVFAIKYADKRKNHEAAATAAAAGGGGGGGGVHGGGGDTHAKEVLNSNSELTARTPNEVTEPTE